MPQEAEPREFRPIPGDEEDWAGFQYVQRSRLWTHLGVYPVGIAISAILVLIGVILCG